MIIQSGFGIQAYSGIIAASIQRLEGHAAAATVAETAKYADQVSLSNAGKALAASESANTEKLPYLPYQEYYLGKASADPKLARELASAKAYGISLLVTDERESRRDPSLLGMNKLSSSGRIIDDAFKEQFWREAPIVDAQRQALYESEKAKGTEPVEILKKLYDFENAQSAVYREATGSGWREGEVAASNPSTSTSAVADLQALRSELDVQRRALLESENLNAAERFEILTSILKAGRQSLIESEKAKETDPAEILRKMIDSRKFEAKEAETASL